MRRPNLMVTQSLSLIIKEVYTALVDDTKPFSQKIKYSYESGNQETKTYVALICESWIKRKGEPLECERNNREMKFLGIS